MRSMPISITIFGFCMTAPFLGCLWSWGIALRFLAHKIGFIEWIIQNSLIYIGFAIFLCFFTFRFKGTKYSETVDKGTYILGIVLGIAIVISTYVTTSIAAWSLKFDFPELAGLDSLVMLLAGIINGVLIGLAILTIGYCYLPQNERKPKV